MKNEVLGHTPCTSFFIKHSQQHQNPIQNSPAVKKCAAPTGKKDVKSKVAAKKWL